MHPVLFALSLPLNVLQILAYGGIILSTVFYGWRAYKTTPEKDRIQAMSPSLLFGVAAMAACVKWLNAKHLDDPYKLTIHTYGLMIAIGFLLGMQLGLREARRIDVSDKRNYDQFIMDLTFWILIVAMIGSRLLFIIVEWEGDYSRDPLKIFRIWEGGLVFYGGFIASVLFSIYFSRRNKRDFFVVADTLIPSVALGHFFGRLGCFAAGCCWGAQVDPSYPLGVRFPPGSLAYNTLQKSGLIAYDAPFTFHVHPVQLYESFGELGIFFLLLFMRTKKRFHGQVLLTYLFVYPILRTTNELMRGDTARGTNIIFGLSTSQIISILLATTALCTLIYLQKKRGAIVPSGGAPAAV